MVGRCDIREFLQPCIGRTRVRTEWFAGSAARALPGRLRAPCRRLADIEKRSEKAHSARAWMADASFSVVGFLGGSSSASESRYLMRRIPFWKQLQVAAIGLAIAALGAAPAAA
jgi:hypothetical protein